MNLPTAQPVVASVTAPSEGAARRYWSHAEKATLRRLASTHDAATIASLLGRTTHAVRQQAHLLRIQLQKAGDFNHGTKYPDALVERIRAMHEGEGKGPTAIARETGVPIGNVKAFIYYANRASASLVLLDAKA